ISSKMETGRISEGCAGWSPGLSSSSAKGKSGEVLSGNHIAHRASDNHPRGDLGSAFPAYFSNNLSPCDRCLGQPPYRPCKIADHASKIARRACPVSALAKPQPEFTRNMKRARKSRARPAD